MEDQGQFFDLNIEKVLEHWTIAHALREIIANALDEAALTNTKPPVIEEVEAHEWIIRDFGRGLRSTHLTQNENKEKFKNATLVIGKFGVGLKDAFATLDRHHIQVLIRSQYGDMSIEHRTKSGFSSISTLHVIIKPPSEPQFVGTEFCLKGIVLDNILQAKSFFLQFSNETILGKTEYGEVYARQHGQKDARIYVNGLHVASEENFLFSYNISSLTTSLRKALNRERTNVGRVAYADRVKKILLTSSESEIASQLAQDLRNFSSGKQHDEVQWNEVALHACRILNATEKVVFVTTTQLTMHSPQIDYAQQDGYRLVVVPDDIARKLPRITDLDGQPMLELGEYTRLWNDSFQFKFIEPEQLKSNEQKIFAMTDKIISLTGKWEKLIHQNVKQILVSETMRLDIQGDAAGLWDEQKGCIIIRRDQLRTLSTYAGTLLHELTHACTSETDVTLEFENGLSQLLGIIAQSALQVSSK